jgi:hypothetical protein
MEPQVEKSPARFFGVRISGVRSLLLTSYNGDAHNRSETV